MKKILFTLIAFPSLMFAEFSANVGLSSNYVWRGVSQTADEIAVSGGFDYSAESGFYAGVWGSNVSFNGEDGGGNEFDIYGGWANDMFDIGVLNYRYPGGNDLDFTELYVGFTGIENLSIYYYDLVTSDFDSDFESEASNYVSVGYEMGDFSVAYGSYGDIGSDILLSYGFSCGKYDCSVSYFDFSGDDVYDELDDNGIYLSVEASF